MAELTPMPAHHTITHAQLLEIWKQAITQGRDEDPHDTVVAELAAYYKMDPNEVRLRCINWEDESVAQWHAEDRSSPEKIIEFFQTQTSWIFDTMWYHANQALGIVFPESVEVAYWLRDEPPRALLDFGGGPGTSAMFFHRLGWKVAIADISTSFQEFAKWRLNLHGVPCAFYNTSSDRLPPNAFNMITAFDVMVHIPDILPTLSELHQSLRANGLLVFNIDSKPANDPRTAYHFYDYHGPIIRHMRAAGFRRRPRAVGFHVYQKVTRPAIINHFIGIFDHLLYSWPNYKLRQLYVWIRERIAKRG
jgi:2-polyprenyl-3-methyl-5-hydroxy-6-metoxy-1,4-benzoquinol methylase